MTNTRCEKVRLATTDRITIWFGIVGILAALTGTYLFHRDQMVRLEVKMEGVEWRLQLLETKD